MLDRQTLRNILIANWMTHDALWYREVAGQFGMASASPMNLRVCRKLGQIEFGRAMKMVGASTPRNITEYRELFQLASDLFVPDFMEVRVSYPSESLQVFHVQDCFAHRGMTQQGLIGGYQCGIFERIDGWLDGMGIRYLRSPDLSRCLKYQGEECTVTVRLHFEQDQSLTVQGAERFQ
jgi:hypothetical protein